MLIGKFPLKNTFVTRDVLSMFSSSGYYNFLRQRQKKPAASQTRFYAKMSYVIFYLILKADLC